MNGAFAHLNKSKILSIDIKKYYHNRYKRLTYFFNNTSSKHIIHRNKGNTNNINNGKILMTLNVNKEFFSSEVELLLNNKI